MNDEIIICQISDLYLFPKFNVIEQNHYFTLPEDVAEKDIFSFDESAYKEKRDDFVMIVAVMLRLFH